jgi:hypothetical protein
MPDKPVAHDAEAWTGHLPTDWPRAADHPQPSPVHARESLSKSITLACLLLFIGISPLLPFRKAAQKNTSAFVAFLLGGLWMTRRSFRIYRQPKSVLTLDERGLAWPGGYEQTIPWSEITRAERNRVFFPAPWLPGVFIHVRDRQRYGPKLLGKVVRADVGQLEGLRPLPWLLDVKPRVVFATIQSYRAHFGRTGTAGG